jgi:23S rRNA pseudouridine1911/1915/1917 synthase
MTLLDRLRQEFPNAKRQNLKRMVEARRVLVNGNPATRLNQPVIEDDQIKIAPTKKPIAQLPFPIIHEDADVIIISKPPGLLTSTTPREPRPTTIAILRNYLSTREPSAKLGLIHRLDRDASGLLVFSKNNRALASLKSQFFHHTVTRIYHAIVSPPPKNDSGHIESLLAERTDGSVHSIRSSRGQRAITDYTVIQRHAQCALLRVALHTGRKHQIRIHLSENGFPILGDEQYCGAPSKSGLALAAIHFAFDHPRTGKRMTFTLDGKNDPLQQHDALRE